MPRIANGTCRKIDYYPWYEWVEKLEWEDDEFEDTKNLKQRLRNEKNRDDELHEMY